MLAALTITTFTPDPGTSPLNSPSKRWAYSAIHCGQGDYLKRLLKGVFGRADLSPSQATQLDLIRQAVYAQEPGGGRLIELLRCFLDAREQSGLAPVGS
jgi:hypothetical protein